MTRPAPTSIFETVLPPDNLDPAFVHIRDDEDCASDRAYLELAWQFYVGAHLQDRHFHRELQTRGKFQARAWELRFAWTLHQLGHNVTAMRPAGPDFTVAGSPTVHFEAITPNATTDLLANHAAARRAPVGLPEDEMVLRATAAIAAKRCKFARYRATGTVNVKDVCVLALSGANIPQAGMWAAVPWVMKPLFGLGREEVTFPVSGDEDWDVAFGYQRLPLRKTVNNAPVDAALFVDDRAEDLSAVVFSPRHLKSRPEYAGFPPGNDFVVVHNPFARHRMPRGFLDCGIEYDLLDGFVTPVRDRRVRPPT